MSSLKAVWLWFGIGKSGLNFSGSYLDKMNNLFVKAPEKYWAYLALFVWGVLVFMLLHKASYGVDEGAAQALLLVWSVVDNVASPVVALGFPDFRAIFLAPVGFLWTGNVLAAKIATIIVMAAAAWAFNAWKKSKGDSEGGLLATGLLLISPLVLDQIDTISVAPFLLLTFVLGAWLEKMYGETPLAFGGMYFAQLFLCMVSITLHPIGLAYPLALLWSWYKSSLHERQRSYFIVGITFAVLLTLALTSGWAHVGWFENPVVSLSSVLLGATDADEIGMLRWVAGVWAMLVLLVVLWKQAGELWADFLGRIFLIALVIGVLTGDAIFAMVALVICLYWGLPLLLYKPENRESGFWGQRGMVLMLILVVSTVFMVVDKGHYQQVMSGDLSPRDSIIRALAEDSGNFLNETPGQDVHDKKTIRVASQWPGLTMLACRCDALPLPPTAKDGEALLAMLRGVNYLIFDPRNPVNSSLSHNLANMGAGKVETAVLQRGGVIVEIKSSLPNKAGE